MDSAILVKLQQQSDNLIRTVSMEHLRFLLHEIEWSWRCIGIRGPRGVGKTTLLLQRMALSRSHSQSVYLSLDDLHFSYHTLRDTIEAFRILGYTHFYLDEVHKYNNWSVEIKNLFDFYPDIHMVFTGSSLIELHRQAVDLSRRAVMYDLPGLSFREYLSLTGVLTYEPLSLHAVLTRHRDICQDIIARVKPVAHFKKYLRLGYYPFFLENETLTLVRIRQVVNLVLQVDLATADGGKVAQSRKIGRLMKVLADSTPFKPNIAHLSRSMELDRDTISRYLQHLERAQLISLLYPAAHSLAALQRPEKIYLDNTTLCYALSAVEPNEGTVRETFFQNQTSFKHTVAYPGKGDFLLDNQYTIEVGGSGKTKKQIAALPDSYLAIDEIETGMGQVIPLWLFGFLY